MIPRNILFTVCVLLATNISRSAEGPLPPEQAAASIKLPEGFKATLFAGEPDVVQPMSIAFDDRGRMWVVECRSYPKWLPADAKEGPDRILIFEDFNEDGRYDTRKVFFEKGVNFSSVEYGFGGVFVIAIPNLLFIPDADGDDVPDGPPQVLIDGFDLNSKHNAPNSLTWGPDGWLYGCNGILSNSRLGRPGTPDDQRIPMNCGIWRYHPTRHTFESVAHGTTNPWGLAFDERGEAFLTNCVIEHAFHVVPGARFKRMFGQDFNPRTFELMQTCADHIHWAGGTWEGSREGRGKHGEAGGGHAHSGAMIYLGKLFPEEFRDCLFTLNIHGQRLNRDKLERSGSSYIARHMTDFAPSGDPWFRGICVKQGLDGSVYFTDWSDTGECHNYDDATTHRDNGRIFKVTYGSSPVRRQLNLAQSSDLELLDEHFNRDRIFTQHARRILQERAVQHKLQKGTVESLFKHFHEQLRSEPQPSNTALQFLWTIHAIGVSPGVLETLDHPDDTIRGWLIRLALENKPTKEGLSHFARLAKTDPSSYVRMQLASGLQRLSLADRADIALELVKHGEDAAENNLTLLTWYGIEPLMSEEDDAVLPLLLATHNPKLRQFMARHLSTGEVPRYQLLLRWLEERQNETNTERDVLTGLHAGLEGRRDLKPDRHWTTIARRLAISSDPVIRELTQQISLIQGSDEAFQELSQIVKNERLSPPERERALLALVATRRPTVANLLLENLNDSKLRAAAIRGLAGYDREEIGHQLLSRYHELSDSEKLDAVSTLTSREKTALSLVTAINAGKIDKKELSEFDIRQIQRYKDPQLKELVQKLFGAKPSSAERAQQIAEMKHQILAGNPQSTKVGRGRTLFQKNCASCHSLFGEGRLIGPELTGAQRTDLDYILINVMDPSALVGHAYRVTVVELKDGRVINGIVKEQDSNTIALQTATDRVVVAKQDIESMQMQSVSMMPDGLLNRLSIQDVRDLVNYLGSPVQVPAE